MKNYATESFPQGFWMCYRSLLPFQNINSWASDSLLAAQIFVTWPRPYFVWHDSAVKNCGQTCPLLFNDYNDEIQLLFRRDAIE